VFRIPIIMLSAATNSELISERDTFRRKLEDMDRERERIQSAIAAIDTVLAVVPIQSQSQSSHNGRVATATKPVPKALRPEQTLGGTLVDRIKRLLDAADGPISAKRVTRALQASGYMQRGKTPLRSIVARELWRLAQTENSGVERVAHGVYAALNGKADRSPTMSA
jgi:hypothetical protein